MNTSPPKYLHISHSNVMAHRQELASSKKILRIPLLRRSEWVPRNQRSKCKLCTRTFGVILSFNQKRHCRSCGEIFCSTCTGKRLIEVQARASPNRTNATRTVKVRICFRCMEIPEEVRDIQDTKYLTSASIAEDLEELESWVGSQDTDLSSMIYTGQNNKRNIGQIQEIEQEDMLVIHRQEIIRDFGIRTSTNTQQYRTLCEIASRSLDAKVAAVGFYGPTAQWYKAKIGISKGELPNNVAFCMQLLHTKGPTFVLDTTKDPRFASNPLVTSSAKIRFYASMPIRAPHSRIVIGSIFVMDTKAKQSIPSRASQILINLSKSAESLIQDGQNMRYPNATIARRARASSYPELATNIDNDTPANEQEIPPSSRNTRQSRSSSDYTEKESISLTQSLPLMRKVHENVEENNGDVKKNEIESQCLELLSRITMTQQQLAKQHSAMHGTLVEHSNQIGSIHESMQRIESLLNKIDS